jgi:SAM-dependent methyltransferase
VTHDHHHDRHGAKQPERFDPARAARLDDPARFGYLPPADVAALLDAPRGGVVVDFGTGTGTYAIELARAHPDLRVVALDEQEPMLELLRAKLAKAPLSNVEPVLSGTEAATRLKGTADRVLALNVLHELGDEALQELASLLKPKGSALFIDWNGAVERPAGPPRDHVYTPAEGRARVEQAGLATIAERLFPFHYAVVSANRRNRTAPRGSKKEKG